MAKTRFAYDTEFIEDGRTIDLISIGIVREDGEEYYAVNADAPMHRIRKHKWLMQNVVPFLPTKQVPIAHKGITVPILDALDPRVKPRDVISQEVYGFLSSGEYDPELWAYCGAYDHVVYAQLWGPMIKLPPGFPMRTNDIAQSLDEFDAWEDRPFQDPETSHDALADARNVMKTLQYIEYAAKPLWTLGEAQKLAGQGVL